MERLGLETMLAGYDGALARYTVAREAARAGGETRDLDIALFETLNWVVSIDDLLRERLGERWYEQVAQQPEQGRVMPGYRFIRNQVHHQWAQAICLDDQPTLLQDWRWRALADLPLVGHRQQYLQDAFEQRLAGRALRHTFRELRVLFDRGRVAALVGESEGAVPDDGLRGAGR